MLYENDSFLKQSIVMLLSHEGVDLFVLIGSIKDLFSSAYITNRVASDDVVGDLWDTLFAVFSEVKEYENKFDAIVAMYDIYFYAKKIDVSLNLEPLKKWRSNHDKNNVSLEVLECVDEMLIK